MNLEKFLREHLAAGNTRLMLNAELDPQTGKVTAMFEDTDQDGSAAHIRVEGDRVIFQSWDEDGEGKPEAPSAAAAKARASEKQAQSAAEKQKSAADKEAAAIAKEAKKQQAAAHVKAEE